MSHILHLYHESCACYKTHRQGSATSCVAIELGQNGASDTYIVVEGLCQVGRFLQCVAVCCSALQCVGVCCNGLECVAMGWSVLECVAAWRSVLECGAVCCSAVPCVVAWCSVVQ